MDRIITFTYFKDGATIEINIRPIELLMPNPTFRIADSNWFLGYVERVAPFEYRKVSDREIDNDILSRAIKTIENVYFREQE